uniref:Uncharacterized protein n=1 Tax=Latimeria chalumnae TaxID=7897 RepID=H2ZSI4_LATCH
SVLRIDYNQWLQNDNTCALLHLWYLFLRNACVFLMHCFSPMVIFFFLKSIVITKLLKFKNLCLIEQSSHMTNYRLLDCDFALKSM